VPIEPLPTDRSPLRHVGDSLEQWRVVAGLGRLDVHQMIEEHWSQLIGPRLARITRPEQVRDGRLLVVTDVPAAAEQVRWQATDLVSAIGSVCGDRGAVVGVDVRVRSAGSSAPVD
jgi:predicted nucleic acid-binding Zn ribbon protein